MFIYPEIDPVAVSFGSFKIHWYGLMYLLGFLAFWLLAHLRIKRYHLNWTSEEISDLVFYGALGVIVGGRLGYMLFYNFQDIINNPLDIFKIWQGGMSFHGGLLGVLSAIFIFSIKKHKNILNIMDFVAPLVPLGLAFGRIGNFINGELWGRPTDVPWAMIYPHVDGQGRHPSQLYELGLEGIALFILTWCYASKPRPQGAVSGVFLIGYAIARIICEIFREPDEQLGFLALNLTMGQILSIPMLIAGVLLWWMSHNEKLPESD